MEIWHDSASRAKLEKEPHEELVNCGDDKKNDNPNPS